MVLFGRDPVTRVTSIAHFDEFTKKTAFERMTDSFLDRYCTSVHTSERQREGAALANKKKYFFYDFGLKIIVY